MVRRISSRKASPKRESENVESVEGLIVALDWERGEKTVVLVNERHSRGHFIAFRAI